MAEYDGGETLPPVLIDEDQPQRFDADMPAEMSSPLAPFAGAAPPSPAWFTQALAKAPERGVVHVDGVDIELLTWGRRGRPGLIFIHGNSAHADWWSFIAPFFADDFRVAALSLSGMGNSGWRDRYSPQTYASEIFACAQAAGLYDAPVAPIYIGHSFGGGQAFYSAINHPERMRACVLVDTGFGGPPTEAEIELWQRQAIAAGQAPVRWRGRPQQGAPHRVYPSLEAALMRFRLMPPQVPGELYIADFIARGSLKRAPMPGEAAEGWTWKFDPGVWAKLDRSDLAPVDPARITVPMVHIVGDRSAIVLRLGPAGLRQEQLPATVPRIFIPEAEHHIMVDQPLALVAAIRSLLSVWQPA